MHPGFWFGEPRRKLTTRTRALPIRPVKKTFEVEYVRTSTTKRNKSTGENQGTQRQTSASATLPFIHLTWTGRVQILVPVLRGCDCLSHGKNFIHLNCIPDVAT